MTSAFTPHPEMLRIHDLHAFYGESHILHGIDIRVARGECVTLLGRNGSGRSTTLKSVLGLVGKRTGSIMVNGREVIAEPTHRMARYGIGYVPEERAIFASLSTEENLMLPPQVKPGGLTTQQIFTLFPNLKERLKSQGTKLSGGEQQMLAIGRALMARPKVLLLDEPSMGLAPMVISQIFRIISEINSQGTTVLLVEQNAQQALSRSDRAYILETGTVTRSGPARELLADDSIRAAYLGVA